MYLNSGSFFCYFTRMNALLFCDLKTKWNKREKEMCLGWPESKWSCDWLPCFSTVLVNSSGNEARESKHQARERQTKYWKMAARLSDKVSSADVNSLFTLIVFPKEKKKQREPLIFCFPLSSFKANQKNMSKLPRGSCRGGRHPTAPEWEREWMVSGIRHQEDIMSFRERLHF